MRITGDMGLVQIVTTISGGFPGSVNALVSIIKGFEGIDPNNSAGPFGYMLVLDQFEIFDQNIYKFYNICEEDEVKFLAGIRGLQLGILSIDNLNILFNDYQNVSLDFPILIKEIRNKIGTFAPSYEF